MGNQEIELRLKKEISKTKDPIAEHKELAKPEAPDDAIGRMSRMDAINNITVVEAAIRKAEEKLKNLARVQDDY